MEDYLFAAGNPLKNTIYLFLSIFPPISLFNHDKVKWAEQFEYKKFRRLEWWNPGVIEFGKCIQLTESWLLFNPRNAFECKILFAFFSAWASSRLASWFIYLCEIRTSIDLGRFSNAENCGTSIAVTAAFSPAKTTTEP